MQYITTQPQAEIFINKNELPFIGILTHVEPNLLCTKNGDKLNIESNDFDTIINTRILSDNLNHLIHIYGKSKDSVLSELVLIKVSPMRK